MCSPPVFTPSTMWSSSQNNSPPGLKYGDRTTTSIVQLLNSLSVNGKIFFQWVPSHVNNCGNEIAYNLAREGSHENSKHSGCLTCLEIATRVKQDVNSSWKQAPVHEWCKGNHPDAALLGTGSKRDETTLTGFRSGHTRAQWHVAGFKVYPSCPKCSMPPASSRSCPDLGLYWLP
ncbi:RNase H domain-containing protein [Trichonephila clavipes]|nr:RNase H domain-containing protein [Trichonephila clavipes]